MRTFDENQKLHSYNDLPAVISASGTKEYWIYGTKVSLITNWIVEGF